MVVNVFTGVTSSKTEFKTSIKATKPSRKINNVPFLLQLYAQQIEHCASFENLTKTSFILDRWKSALLR